MQASNFLVWFVDICNKFNRMSMQQMVHHAADDITNSALPTKSSTDAYLSGLSWEIERASLSGRIIP